LNYSTSGPLSLNIYQRKKEHEQIHKDNDRFATRLVKKKSSFSSMNKDYKNYLRRDFIHHNYLKNMVSKNKKYKLSNYKLPPISVFLISTIGTL